MFRFTNYIDAKAFFISFAIGIFIFYILSPPKKIVIKWPNPDTSNKIIYKDHSDNCYKYKPNEVTCPSDKKKIKNIETQYVESEK
jgi:hypothetical protein